MDEKVGAQAAVAPDRPATPLTRTLAAHARGYEFANLPTDVVFLARQCFLDWLGVALAGAHEPLVQILCDDAVAQGGHPQATLVGRDERLATQQAALVNGAASHALDFDDVHLGMSGHPSAPVFPALLALAEARGATGRDFITAFVAGVETECRIGALVLPGHYDAGWHATATLGTFGAAAACAHLLRLDAEQWQHAFGIAGTQAAGLKSMFGTMCKPFHAGAAARNGLLAATLAARGFISNPAVLDDPQGFAATHATTLAPERALAGLGETFAIRGVLFKYHAACYGTHAAIEAVLRLKERHGITADQVQAIALRVAPVQLGVCNIPEPRTALEGKFSLRFTAALALAGNDTGEAAFTDAAVRDPMLVAVRDRVRVEIDPALKLAECEAVLTLADGRELREFVNLELPASDLDGQWQRLVAKFRGLAVPALGEAQTNELLAAVAGLEHATTMADVARLCAPRADGRPNARDHGVGGERQLAAAGERHTARRAMRSVSQGAGDA